MKATGIVRRIEASVIKTPRIYIAKARGKSPRFYAKNLIGINSRDYLHNSSYHFQNR